MHTDFLVAKSRFFAAACSERWSKNDGTIRLPEVLPETFRVYLGWVYSHDVKLDPAAVDSDEINTYEQAKFCELYLLADTLDDVKLRNRVMEILVTSARGLPHPNTVWRVYDSTICTSLIREMLVDKAIMRLSRSDFAKNVSEYPCEFVQEVAIQLMGHESVRPKDKFVARLPFYQEPLSESA